MGGAMIRITRIGHVALRVADIELDATSREVRRGERVIDLTTREYAILELFVRNPNRVLSRDVIPVQAPAVQPKDSSWPDLFRP